MYLTLYAALIAAYVSVVFYPARKAGEADAQADIPRGMMPSHFRSAQ